MSSGCLYVLILLCPWISSAYKSGSPRSACVHMTPGHRMKPQTGESLYSLEVFGQGQYYQPGITVRSKIHLRAELYNVKLCIATAIHNLTSVKNTLDF